MKVVIDGVEYVPLEECGTARPIRIGDFVRVVRADRADYTIGWDAVGECGKVKRCSETRGGRLVVELPGVPNEYEHQWHFEPEDLELVEE